MANVTVNIQGNAGSSGGGNGGGGNQNQPTPPSSNPTTGGGTTPSSSPVQPPDSRLVEEVRRAIIQQGAVFVPGNNTYKPIIQQAEQVQRERLNADITQKYDTRRADVQTRMSAEYDRIDKTIDESKKRALEQSFKCNYYYLPTLLDIEPKRQGYYRNRDNDLVLSF